jgi:hypothetical protein
LSRPDTDVGETAPAYARAPRGACAGGLARLLLSTSRKVLLVSLLFASSACIIPVVPDFEDPPAAQNFPPQILEPNPSFGIAIGNTFSARLLELNPTDSLHVRWIADIQPDGSTNRSLRGGGDHLPNKDGQALDVPTRVEVSCEFDFLAKTIEIHTIHLLVGDRDFADDRDPRRLMNGDLAVQAIWTWVFRCP